MIHSMDIDSVCGAEYQAVVEEDSANAKPFGHMVVDTLFEMYDNKRKFIRPRDRKSAIMEIFKLFHRVGCLLLEAEGIQIEQNNKLGLSEGKPVISGELGEIVSYLYKDIKIKPRRGKRSPTKIRWIRGACSVHEAPMKMKVVAQARQLLEEVHELNSYYLMAGIANLKIAEDGSLTSVPNPKAEEDMLALIQMCISEVKKKSCYLPADRVVVDCSKLPKYFFLHRDSYDFKGVYYRLQKACSSFDEKVKRIFDEYSNDPEKAIQAQPITFRQLIQQKGLRSLFNKSYGPDATASLDAAPLEFFQELDVVRGQGGLAQESVLGPYRSHEAMFLFCALANAIPGLVKTTFNVKFIKSVMECGELVLGPPEASLYLCLRFRKSFVYPPLLGQAPKASIVTARIANSILLSPKRDWKRNQLNSIRDSPVALTEHGFLTEDDLFFRPKIVVMLDQFATHQGQPALSKEVAQSPSLVELLEQEQVKRLLSQAYGKAFCARFYYPTYNETFLTWAACFKQIDVVERDGESTNRVLGPYYAYQALSLFFVFAIERLSNLAVEGQGNFNYKPVFNIDFIRSLMEANKRNLELPVSVSEDESLCLRLRFSVPNNYEDIWRGEGPSVAPISYTTKTIFIGPKGKWGAQDCESQDTNKLPLTIYGFA